MLNSIEIHQALNELGYRLEAGEPEPSYASEHALGNGKYLYVKRRQDGVVNKSPLVLAPETLALKAEIDRISGIRVSQNPIVVDQMDKHEKSIALKGDLSHAVKQAVVQALLKEGDIVRTLIKDPQFMPSNVELIFDMMKQNKNMNI